MQPLESITQQHVNNTNDVNLSTQLSISDSCDSSSSTSTQQMFTCRTNINSNGNLLFPLAEKEMKHTQKMSWHDLLKYLKSQRIVKNIEIFKKFKRKRQHNSDTQQFPSEIEQARIENFPCQYIAEAKLSSENINIFHNATKRKEIKNVRKLKFPLKSATEKGTFPYNSKGLNDKNENKFHIKIPKIHQLNSKTKRYIKIKRHVKKLRTDKDSTRFPCTKDQTKKSNTEFPLPYNSKSLYSKNKVLKFPQKLSDNVENFPFIKKPPGESNLIFDNTKQFQIGKCSKSLSIKTNSVKIFEQNLLRKFPKASAAHYSLSEFPIQNHDLGNKYTEHEYLYNNSDSKNYQKVNNSNNLKISTSSPTILMTQNSQKFKNIDNEHVSQVQDAQIHVKENPLALTTNKIKQPPPQTAMAKTIYDDYDVYLLAAINSINNTQENEVGYYAEKIERIQDAIVALFEKIQNSLTTNHNSERENTNAVRHDYCEGGDARFALTPPNSVTSVQNTERTYKEEVPHNNYDLSDLWDRQVGQIVEHSDVRDTLTEAVDYGVTKEQTNITGSFLVKSDEPTSPISPTPNPLNNSINTSLEDYSNASELLPKYNVLEVNREINVDVKNKLEFDPIKASHEQNELNEINELSVKNTHENNLISVKVNEMTVTRLVDNERENTNEDNYLHSNEALEHKNNLLTNDLQIDEMKFEMNKVKGALPSSISERSLGKHENLKTGSMKSQYGRYNGTNPTRLSTDTILSHNRLPSSQSLERNYNDSSYKPRTFLKNENSAASKHSTLNSHLPPEAIAKRSILNTPSLRETISNHETSSDTITKRRPSLGALRNTQSTSLLSVDLAHYTPLATAKQTEQSSPINRAVSIDSSLGDVLPDRTRLRRQRRLRNQNSQDEPEDPIERLNRIKARISASLSEVKGVLKQYSTEAENDNENQAIENKTQANKEEEKKEEGPVVFRFVKKVRRRSLFSEEDENEPKEKKDEASIENTENLEKQLYSKDETDNIKLPIGLTLPTKSSEIFKEQIQETLEKQVDSKTKDIDVTENKESPSLETNELKINKDLYTLKEEIQESLEDTAQTENKQEYHIAQEQTKIVQQEDNNKAPKNELQSLKEETKGAIPKPNLKQENKQLENISTAESTNTKVKRKVIIKSKDPSRRVSLAAVEGSKIEPPVKVAIPAKTQRRPSDSEAMVKKKLIIAKINTSGAVEEVTPKLKIVKVKRSSIKSNNNSQLATTQQKLKEENNTMAAANDKSNDHVKSTEEDNKSIQTDKSKDVLMPEQQKQQQNINTEITSQTNLLLPTQLVIDEAASLNVKTIKNSVLPPRQQQQQQEQKQEKQATIKSTTTNFKSNNSQAGGAMLENLTTVLSSSTASEANGQIKRENEVQQDDLRDLLQQQTAIIKPSTANKQKEVTVVKQVENNQLEVKDLLLNRGFTEKLNENLEEKQNKSTIQQQQVVTATDVVVVKSDDNDSKHEDFKVKASLKEPCTDKTPALTHIDVEGEQSIANVADTKTISSPHISISSTPVITEKTTESSTKPLVAQTVEVTKNQQGTMPELQLAPAPVQTAEIISHPENLKKKTILKKIVRQSSVDKTKKAEIEITKPAEESEQVALETPSPLEPTKEELTEECSESTEISETSASIDSEEVAATETPKKERKVKKKVIIKRQKRRLSIGDSFFHPGGEQESQNADIETLEKPIAYVTDDENDENDEQEEEAINSQEQEEAKKPLKSCIMHKEYHIGDEVLYAERFKKTQIKWRRGRIKERITSISYLLDIDGKDVSSHINYLKKFTGRKVSFGGKEYLEIDYEQLAEEEEKAERLQRRTYSIWNMV